MRFTMRSIRTGAAALASAALALAGMIAILAPGAAAAAGSQLVVHQTGLDFGLVDVATTSPAQVSTLENVGTAVLAITSISAPGSPFARTTTCGATLAVGATCTVSYTFTPASAGPASAVSAVTTDGGTTWIDLRSSGVEAQAFPLLLTPTTMDFGDVPAGTDSPQQSVTITNTTAASVNFQFAGGGLAGAFSNSTACGGTVHTLAAGASCDTNYVFAPNAEGPATATSAITLTIYTPGPPASATPTAVTRNYPIIVNGVGTFPLVLTPTTLDFGDVPAGAASPSQSVTITNPTAVSVNFQFAGGGMSGAFVNSTACGGTVHTLAAGASCTTDYVFAPTALGAATATSAITLTMYTRGAPATAMPTTAAHNFPIIVNGVGTFPLVLTPTTLDFGDVVVGATSPTQYVTVTNPTAASLNFQFAGGGMSGAFSNSTACGGTVHTLAAGATCTTGYIFAPTATGPATATSAITLTMYTPGAPASATATTASRNVPIIVNGVGVATAAGAFPLLLTPIVLDFGDVPVGTTSPTQTVLITNTTAASVNFQFAGGGMSGAFSNSTACGGTVHTLAAGASCDTTYAFSPVAVGPATATSAISLTLYTPGDPLTATSTGTSRNYPVTANGTGTFPLLLTPIVMDFGNVAAGTTSPAQTVTITNITSSAVNFEFAGGGMPAPFDNATACGGSPHTLAAGASCVTTYTFTPAALGAAEQTAGIALTIFTAGAPASAQRTTAIRNYPVNARGTGTFPLLLTPIVMNFGDIAVGTTSPSQSVLITNVTSATVNFEFAGGGMSVPFTNSTACGGSPRTLAAGASCTTDYTFTPTALGAAERTAGITLTIYTPGPSASAQRTTASRNFPVTARGVGIGAGPHLTVSAYRLDFGPVTVGTPAPTLIATVRNDGTGTLTGLSIGALSNPQFTRTTTCVSGTLAAGGSCTVTMTVNPTAVGALSGTIAITSAAGPGAIELAALGIAPAITLPPTTTAPTTTAPTTPAATSPASTLPTAGSGTLAATGPQQAAGLTLLAGALVALGAAAVLLASGSASRRRRQH
jgi:hypothetical protein